MITEQNVFCYRGILFGYRGNLFGYRGEFDNRTHCLFGYRGIRMFGYRKCRFGILITERSVMEVLGCSVIEVLVYSAKSNCRT